MTRPRILVAWSSGKDSAWALYKLRQAGEYDVVGLLTTYSQSSQRVPQHEVRLGVIELQAAAVGLPLTTVALPSPCPNVEYEECLHSIFASAAARGVTAVAYGDLHLADIRAYRERLHADTGLTPLFPLWGRDTTELAQEMAAGGLRALVTAVDTSVLPPVYAGQEFSPGMLASLPPGVDHCGENGEFHTCVWDGPMFGAPLRLSTGSKEQRGNMYVCDVLPQEAFQPDPA